MIPHALGGGHRTLSPEIRSVSIARLVGGTAARTPQKPGLGWNHPGDETAGDGLPHDASRAEPHQQRRWRVMCRNPA